MKCHIIYHRSCFFKVLHQAQRLRKTEVLKCITTYPTSNFYIPFYIPRIIFFNAIFKNELINQQNKCVRTGYTVAYPRIFPTKCCWSETICVVLADWSNALGITCGDQRSYFLPSKGAVSPVCSPSNKILVIITCGNDNDGMIIS